MLFFHLIYAFVVARAAALPGNSINDFDGCQNTREIVVDAAHVVGKFKNLQGTNNANTALVDDPNDIIDDMKPAIANLWPEYGIKHVLIYTFPSVFLGFGKNGTAGDATNNDNYNWTVTDQYIKFVTSRGAVASIQFNEADGTNSSISSPEILGQIGYMITDHAIELYDFYAESDLTNTPTIEEAYENSFKYFAAFARGVANASTKAGVVAWGSNRIVPTHANYSVYDPYISRFYADCAAQNVPIKAATYHFTNVQFSFDPYAVKTLTDRFREEILVPAGLPDLEVWVTEYEPNPSGALPTSASALASYNDPAWFAGFLLGTSMYAQDTSLTQALSWTGFGYGGYGAGHAYFQPWFSLTSNNKTVPLNAAAAWKLQASLVTNTSQRLDLQGSSPDGFAALAGESESGEIVQVMLNNYQLDYDIVHHISIHPQQHIPSSKIMDCSTENKPANTPVMLCLKYRVSNVLNQSRTSPLRTDTVCQIYVQATIRDNHSDSYRLLLNNLPWNSTDAYTLTIQRVGGGQLHQVYKTSHGVGNCVDITVPFPANAQDLVTI
ncbi:uncharacterized protein LY89DRAFT_742942 [Mollisia scopiformis]|uniref:Uncharacterized protein n=1 Tax=Mollisia scopiformis TaxID=149040 RepID=A0A132B5N1_MOLSC|nr:uncharacterized protein LY89DRAFT_742942 [Mollisia scopiformis]KUJ07299.1 hypothetical protein LY89DRAFT_742942 [Mollisia scopiformis]